MSGLVIFESKLVEEELSLQFNFSDCLLFGEIIIGSSVEAAVYSGEDPSPSDIISGASTDDGQTVTQLVVGGVLGVIYNLICTVVGSAGNKYIKVARLALISP